MEGELDTDLLEIRDALVELRGCCRSLLALWQLYIDQLDSNYTVVSRAQMESYQAPRVRQGRGRPHVIISQEQLQYLRSMRFSWTQISELLGVSRMTVYRRRRDLGLLDFDDATRTSEVATGDTSRDAKRGRGPSRYVTRAKPEGLHKTVLRVQISYIHPSEVIVQLTCTIVSILFHSCLATLICPRVY